MMEFFIVLKEYFKNYSNFNQVKTYCFFIGYPRSGHTLVRALLDAHPNIIISNELDVFCFLEKGIISKRWLFAKILANSKKHAQKNNQWTGYSYETPNLWQGKYTKLKVIGDKKGGVSTRRLAGREKELLEKLKSTVGIQIKVIHIIRNPYDNITTISKRSNRILEDSIKAYFDDIQKIEQIKKNLGGIKLCELHHEDIVSNPKKSIKILCDFLGQETEKEYIDKCVDMVYKKPHQSRFSVQWSVLLKEKVKKSCENVNFLEDYRYDI